ncbi:MAG: hypothetical protein HZA77_01155 [Candidatus Schekmanbacteria bacterium]|nr:hypothetical protein [Candidatus Schekmanbacteria bacterium]
MTINILRKKVKGEEFDYQILLDCLKGVKCPRDKITNMLKRGMIIRIKKGIYVFGKDYARSPFSREVLANMIYGPSYISLEYALHYYGFIPERVEALTSSTCGRGRKFSTPAGLFIYCSIPRKAYSKGIDRVEISGGSSFLIAVPEKALADKVFLDRGTGIKTQREMERYLSENLRIDFSQLERLNHNLICELASCYGSRKIRLLSELIHKSAK